MRTQQRDRDGTITFGAIIVDAASGSGIANGVPYVWTRTATGKYTLTFDMRVIPVTVTTSGVSSVIPSAATPAVSPGAIGIDLANNAGVLTNGHFRFSCTALDKRT